MERVMLAKKKEVLQEFEKAKKRILHELYCVKRSVHTDFCEMLADYNRIVADLKKLATDLKADSEQVCNELRVLFAETVNEYSAQINNKITAWEQFETTVTEEINDALLELEALKSQVDSLVTEWEQIADDSVRQSDLDALKQEMQNAIDDAVSSIDFEQFKAEVETMIVQSDWEERDDTSKAFIKHKPFGEHYTTILSYDGNGVYGHTIENKNIIIVLPDTFNLEEGRLYELTYSTDTKVYKAMLKGIKRSVVYNDSTHEIISVGGINGLFYTSPMHNKAFRCTGAMTDNACFMSITKHPTYGYCIITYASENGETTSNEFHAAFHVELAEVTFDVINPLLLGTHSDDGVLTLYKNNVYWEKPFYSKGRGFLGTVPIVNSAGVYPDGLPTDKQIACEAGKVYDVYINDNFYCSSEAKKLNQDVVIYRTNSNNWDGLTIYQRIIDGVVFIRAWAKDVDDVAIGDVVSIYEHDYTEEINPVNAFKLISPSGSIYKLTVNDDGTLSITLATE